MAAGVVLQVPFDVFEHIYLQSTESLNHAITDWFELRFGKIILVKIRCWTDGGELPGMGVVLAWPGLLPRRQCTQVRRPGERSSLVLRQPHRGAHMKLSEQLEQVRNWLVDQHDHLVGHWTTSGQAHFNAQLTKLTKLTEAMAAAKQQESAIHSSWEFFSGEWDPDDIDRHKFTNELAELAGEPTNG